MKQKLSNEVKEIAQRKSTAKQVENKGNKRKRLEELPLKLDVKAEPAKRMTRQKLMKESELTKCESNEAATKRTKSTKIAKLNTSASEEVIQPTQRITRRKAALIEKGEEMCPVKSPKTKKRKQPAHKSPQVKSPRITRSR